MTTIISDGTDMAIKELIYGTNARKPTRIAILLTFYNGIKYLKQAVDSVKAQTYTNWILYLAVNGHPLDKDGNIIDPIIRNQLNNITSDENKPDEAEIKLITFPIDKIKGRSQALNAVAEIAKKTCNWGCILDADDWWDSQKLQEQVEFLLDKNKYEYIDVVGTQTHYVRCNGNHEYIEKVNVVPCGIILGLSRLLCKNPIINSSAMFLLLNAYWNENWDGIEDYDMWLRFAYEGNAFYNLSKHLCYHRIRADSAFNGKQHDIDKLLQFWKNM